MDHRRQRLHRRDPFEQRMLLEYTDNLRRNANSLGISKAELKKALAGVLESSALGIGADDAEIADELDEEEELPLRELVRMLGRIKATLKAAECPPLSSLQQHVDALARFFALDEPTADLYGLIIRMLVSDGAMSLWKACHSYADPTARVSDLHWLAAVAGVPRACADALTPEGVLVTSGLCTLQCTAEIEIPEALRKLLLMHATPPQDLTAHLIGPVRPPRLPWEDFSSLGRSRDLVARILSRRGSQGECGVHVLLYGPPGTGKTEFAATLARQLRMPLVALGECDGDGNEPDRGERLATLRRAASVLSRRPRKLLLLVDEAEDVLETAEVADFVGVRSLRQTGSKVYLHRMMETFPVPVIWIVNDLWRLQDTVIRRMMYVLEFRRPGVETRKAIWTRTLQAWDLPATEPEIDHLSREFAVPPAVASSAARVATLINGGLSEVREIAGNLAKALNGGVEPQAERSAAEHYLPVLVNTDARSIQVLDRIAACGYQGQGFSLCLHGPPGTGKSAYARHLASKLGLEVVQKRASDLVSKWVGDTEKRIAKAFRDARAQGAMLIFDEAESLLRSRELSHASWEISQVNEMLTWMESHPLPFVCTTNLLDALDAASLRRFTFKLRFDYLSREQVRKAYAHFFGRAAPPELDLIDLLTPSDFALARNRASLGGFEHDDQAALDLLRGESQLKPDFRRAIGFQ